MSDDFREALKVCLSGDWSIGGVAEHFQLLAQEVARLSRPRNAEETNTAAAQALAEIDISGITALDACGCQLLARFCRAAQQSGMALRICNIPDTFMAKIRRLGFSNDLQLSL